MQRIFALLPFIMVKSHIIIWMNIFNNSVGRLAEVWGLLRGGLCEAKVLRSDICLSEKDKWHQAGAAGLPAFMSVAPLSPAFRQKCSIQERNNFVDMRASEHLKVQRKACFCFLFPCRFSSFVLLRVHHGSWILKLLSVPPTPLWLQHDVGALRLWFSNQTKSN